MEYEIICPDCGEINQVATEEAVREWVCDICNAHAYTSFPTDEEGNLINGD